MGIFYSKIDVYVGTDPKDPWGYPNPYRNL